MRVAHFIDSLVLGGAETMLLDLVERMRARGTDARIVHFGHRELSAGCQARSIPQMHAPAHRDFKSFRRLPLFARAFRRFLREHRFELLHSHLFGAITGASLAARSARIPHVGTLHDTHMVADDPRRMWLLRSASWLDTRLVSVSAEAREFYRGLGGLRRGDPLVIRNGVAPHSNGAVDDGRENVRYISVGRLVPLKGFDRLIRAFSAMQGESKAELWIVGDGPERARLEALARSLKADVVFLGLRDDVDELLARSDVFVLASETEALSRSILEAMAHRLPCVATDVGGNHELIIDRETGRLVALEDEEELARVLGELRDQPDLRKRLGRAGGARILNELSLDQCVERYCELYAKLL
ncbi:MAG: glycosyltransferase family 4 protein [Myxococcota bacterium]